MTAPDPRTVSRQRAEAIHAEHAELRGLLSKITSVEDVDQLVPLLTELRELLVTHFHTEEAPEGLRSITMREPQYMVRLEKIFEEHRVLLVFLDDIARRATELRERRANVLRDVAHLALKLHEHEADESDLMMTACFTDLGQGQD